MIMVLSLYQHKTVNNRLYIQSFYYKRNITKIQRSYFHSPFRNFGSRIIVNFVFYTSRKVIIQKSFVNVLFHFESKIFDWSSVFGEFVFFFACFNLNLYNKWFDFKFFLIFHHFYRANKFFSSSFEQYVSDLNWREHMNTARTNNNNSTIPWYGF